MMEQDIRRPIMEGSRKIFDDMPDVIPVPAHLRHRRVEVIMLTLDDESAPLEEGNHWPPGFFEATEGAWQGEIPERAPQGEYEQRDELP
jgi:hypothetical protein